MVMARDSMVMTREGAATDRESQQKSESAHILLSGAGLLCFGEGGNALQSTLVPMLVGLSGVTRGMHDITAKSHKRSLAWMHGDAEGSISTLERTNAHI